MLQRRSTILVKYKYLTDYAGGNVMRDIGMYVVLRSEMMFLRGVDFGIKL